jgi:hypothetical protein
MISCEQAGLRDSNAVRELPDTASTRGTRFDRSVERYIVREGRTPHDGRPGIIEQSADI